MSEDYSREWTWKSPGHHNYVRILHDGRLEWGGWEERPRGGGGAVYQKAQEFLRTGKPGYSWMNPPEKVLNALREALS